MQILRHFFAKNRVLLYIISRLICIFGKKAVPLQRKIKIITIMPEISSFYGNWERLGKSEEPMRIDPLQ
jgi:hypothetical protein